MKITESKLRSLIRSVIVESMHDESGHDENVLDPYKGITVVDSDPRFEHITQVIMDGIQEFCAMRDCREMTEELVEEVKEWCYENLGDDPLGYEYDLAGAFADSSDGDEVNILMYVEGKVLSGILRHINATGI